MMVDVMKYALVFVLLVCVSVSAKLREPFPFKDAPTLHVFEAEPAPLPDNKTVKADIKAHVYYPQQVVTEGKHYADEQSLIMVLDGFKNVPVSLDYAMGDVTAGEYRWFASVAIGGKAGQKVEVFAGPDAEHLTLRGTITKPNTTSWKNDWFTCDKPVHIDATDKMIRYTFTGHATNRKIIDALVLEPLTE